MCYVTAIRWYRFKKEIKGAKWDWTLEKNRNGGNVSHNQSKSERWNLDCENSWTVLKRLDFAWIMTYPKTKWI